MTDTNQLIEQLAARAKPVRPLASPWRRALVWFALAATVVAVICLVSGLRADLATAMSVPATAIEWLASTLTGLLAGYAAFLVSVPGRSPRWIWLPLPALVLWLVSIGLGCLGEWWQVGSQAFAFDDHGAQCFGMITLVSLPLTLVLLLMVRHAGAVRPAETALLATLSAAALSSAAVSLVHDGESALMVLAWHASAVALLTGLGWVLSRRLFAWIGYGRA